jgi:hypothetical protein
VEGRWRGTCLLQCLALLQAEEELAACHAFDRIFPTHRTHSYFQFFQEVIPTAPHFLHLQVTYYDKLLDASEQLVLSRGRPALVQEVTWPRDQHRR